MLKSCEEWSDECGGGEMCEPKGRQDDYTCILHQNAPSALLM